MIAGHEPQMTQAFHIPVNAYRYNLSLALKDLRDGICSIYVWPMLGWFEIKQRYRRSLLGPFWLTIVWAAPGSVDTTLS